MRLYKLKGLYFVKPDNMLFNVVNPENATDIETMEEGAKLTLCKNIFSSLDFVSVDGLSWRFDDDNQKVYLVGECTQDEHVKLEIFHKDTLKLLCSAIGYEMRKQIKIQ